MKVLVAYYSQTGNTEKIATIFHEEFSKKYDTHLEKINSILPEETNEFDLVLVGAPCIDSDLAVPLKKFLDNLPMSPDFKLVGFYTHATIMSDDEYQGGLFTKWAGRCLPTFEQVCKTRQIKFLGAFHCMGKASPSLEIFIHKEIITDENDWEKYLADLRTHPNEDDITNARQFIHNLLSKLA